MIDSPTTSTSWRRSPPLLRRPFQLPTRFNPAPYRRSKAAMFATTSTASRRLEHRAGWKNEIETFGEPHTAEIECRRADVFSSRYSKSLPLTAGSAANSAAVGGGRREMDLR